MEFNREIGSATYRIQSYQPGQIKVSNHNHNAPILISAEKLISPWEVTSFEDLKREDFDYILTLKPDLVLIGSGFDEHTTPLFLPKEIIQPLIHHGVGVEVMSTPAACRTYTILVSEGRNVITGLFV